MMLKFRTTIPIGLVALVLLLAGATRAQEETRIPAGSKVYIEPMDGFETYMAAALQKKRVQLIVVAIKEQADFEITGTAKMRRPGLPEIILGKDGLEVWASVQVVNIKSGVVAYAVSSHKRNALRGYKSAAEHIAKNIGKRVAVAARATTS